MSGKKKTLIMTLIVIGLMLIVFYVVKINDQAKPHQGCDIKGC